MKRLTVVNLTNSPFDLEGGHRLPAMGRLTADFSDGYAEALRASPGVEARLPAPADRLSDAEKEALRPALHPLDHDGDGRKGGSKRGTRKRTTRKRG